MREPTLKLILCACATITAAAQVPAQQLPVEGLWGAEYEARRAVRGELLVRADGAAYVASISGRSVTVVPDGSQIRFSMPDGSGEFRGAMAKDRQTITGHWIQPSGPVSFQPRATPVQLKASRARSWSGQVSPLPERMRIFVQIRRDAGQLVAVIRIPETNRGGNLVFPVELSGEDLLLKGPPDIRGRYDARADRLLLPIFGDPPPSLSRRTTNDALGFHPRTPWPATYEYRQPQRAGDGWSTATLDQAALDARAIRSLIQTMLDADPGDRNTVPIHSILIARRGRLAVEEYFYGFDRDRPHDTRSAGKTFAPLLAGIARDRGGNLRPEMRVTELLPQYRPFRNDDPRKAKLTLEHLMTMRSGLACDDVDPASPGGEERMQRQRDQPDWYKYTVDLPMVREPGSATVYCSADLNLVGGIAGAAAGLWNADLFLHHIAKPMQFQTYHLNLMPTGDAYMGGGVYLRPRDALKLGQLYLNGGVWNGVRVISADWVQRSLTSYGTFVRPVVETDVDHRYGYGWHVHEFTVSGRAYRMFAAEGNGGQFVMVFPSLDMVVGVTAGKYGSPAWYRWGLDVISRYLIPAATGGN